MTRTQHIVVPVDLSTNSIPAAHAASWLCRVLGADVTLLHVVDGEPVAKVEDELELIAGQFFLDVDTTMRIDESTNDPATATCALAKSIGASLIVMGTHGRSALRHAFFGSNATRVVRHAPCDVLTVRPPQPHDSLSHVKLRSWVVAQSGTASVRNILCPIELFGGSNAAVARAKGLARQFGAKLHLLHVVRAPTAEARAQIDALCDEPDIDVEGHIVLGDAAPTILDATADMEADLVVMGTRGAGGFEAWAVGSTCERVVRTSHAPVWTVRGPR